jgi:hypothetical protein
VWSGNGTHGSRDIADWWRETSDTAGTLLVRGEGEGGDSLGTSLIGGEGRGG